MSTTTRYIHFADKARAALAERAAAPALAGMAAATGHLTPTSSRCTVGRGGRRDGIPFHRKPMG